VKTNGLMPPTNAAANERTLLPPILFHAKKFFWTPCFFLAGANSFPPQLNFFAISRSKRRALCLGFQFLSSAYFFSSTRAKFFSSPFDFFGIAR